jgi:hypothetical protein
MIVNPTIRLRFKFRLRTFFIAFTAICIVLGLFGQRYDRMANQKAGIAALLKRGHQVIGLSDKKMGMHETLVVYLCEATDDDLAIVSRLPSVVAIYSESSRFNDEGIAHLRRLRALQSLSIVKAAITDRSLASIGALTQLEVFHLSGTLITEDGLRMLSRKLPSCKIDYQARKPRYRDQERPVTTASNKRDFLERF